METRQRFIEMSALLGRTDSPEALERKVRVVAEIKRLKAERNAVILGHNYMETAILEFVSDYTGDSLELSRIAAGVGRDVIVFCGVEFMAETAKILSPASRVLIPARGAGCSLAESITAEDVRALRARFPGVPVVTYINTYADVKAETDICCTSGNAAAVVNSLKGDTVIFLPDEFLARNVARSTGRHVIFPSFDGERDDPELDFQMIGWKGRCEVHERYTAEQVREIRGRYPDVFILAHPECPPEVAEAVDFCGGTSAMIRVVRETRHPRYLLLTEAAMADYLAAEMPDKVFLRDRGIRCPHMEKITLENTLEALRLLRYEVTVPDEIRLRALRAVERMLRVG